MKQLKIMALCGILVMLVAGLTGCGSKADENKPIADVEAEAAKMDAAGLKKMAIAYKDKIMAKKGELEKLTEKFKGLAPNKLEEVKSLTADMDSLKTSIANLQKRFDVYYKKLKEKGGDVSGLSIK